MTDELPFGEPLTESNPGAAPRRKCGHPRSSRLVTTEGWSCERCGHSVPREASRLGRRNRSRGNDVERVIGKQLGLRRVGQFGGPTDLGESRDPFVVSVKSGGYWTERYWSELKRQVAESSQTRLLVVAETPGRGRKRRAVVILDLDDWIGLHGPAGVS